MITLDPKTAAQAEMLANRLSKRQKHLRKWARRTGTGVYRLYDRDIPEIPLVMDWYTPAEEGAEAAVAGALYKRPYDKDEGEEAAWLFAMKTAAAGALGIREERIFFRERRRLRERKNIPGRGAGAPGRGAGAPGMGGDAAGTEMIVQEGGLRFKVRLSLYLDTGLFPDRRLLRALFRSEAAEKRVLNLFSYTGAFSVYAAAGGAAAVDSVDLSAVYLDWARENFFLNGLAVQKKSGSGGGGQYRFIRTDVLAFLETARREKRRWDLIILDPPSFSNSKKMQTTLDIKRDQTELLSQSLALLEPGGKLYLSVNAHGFKIDQKALTERRRALTITDIGERLRDEDFKDRRIPGCWELR